MTKKEMDQYNQAQDRYFAGTATSKDVLKVLELRRKWESEEKARTETQRKIDRAIKATNRLRAGAE
jgi:hypothetical protein